VLAAPARLNVLDHLRASAEPMDAHAVAAATGLHVTSARAHLDALIEAGLVVSQRQPPKGRGRPRTLYAPAYRQSRGGDPYRDLIDLLAAHFGDTPAGRSRRARQAGHTWAAQRLDATPDARSAPSRSPAEARQVVAALFTEIGFDPEPASDGRLLLHGCPFRDTARAHPEVVCAAHEGLLAGLLARLDPAAPVPVLEPFVRPDLCAVSFGDLPGEPEVG
jgi:predicted ArsR family transcriptional regulator